MSNLFNLPDVGEGLTEAVYELVFHRYECFIRAEVTDENGLQAWSNILML